jgi:hypothetical protein
MSAFRRRLRLHQARWRETHGHPIGSQPIVPRKGTATRLVGSRLPLAYAQATGANFVTAGALAAARTRASNPESHQRFDHQRLWADLLWSPTLAFNLFGDLAADPSLADRAVHSWWPDAPGAVCETRFEHSPGRLDPTYLGSLRSFDAAFVLDLHDGTRGIVAIDVEYHDRGKPAIAKPAGRPLQRKIARRSGIFHRGAIDAADRTDLLVTSLEHAAAPLDAPTQKRRLELGSLRRRLSRRQLRLRRGVRPLRRAPHGAHHLRRDHARTTPQHRCAADENTRDAPRAIHRRLILVTLAL